MGDEIRASFLSRAKSLRVEQLLPVANCIRILEKVTSPGTVYTVVIAFIGEATNSSTANYHKKWPTALTTYHSHIDRVRGFVLAVLHSPHNTTVLLGPAWLGLDHLDP